MQINATIQLEEWDTGFDMSAHEIADAFFAALGGDENKDRCTATVYPMPGSVGVPPAPLVETEPPLA